MNTVYVQWVGEQIYVFMEEIFITNNHTKIIKAMYVCMYVASIQLNGYRQFNKIL